MVIFLRRAASVTLSLIVEAVRLWLWHRALLWCHIETEVTT